MFDATAKAVAEGISSQLPDQKTRERSGVLTTVPQSNKKTRPDLRRDPNGSKFP